MGGGYPGKEAKGVGSGETETVVAGQAAVSQSPFTQWAGCALAQEGMRWWGTPTHFSPAWRQMGLATSRVWALL